MPKKFESIEAWLRFKEQQVKEMQTERDEAIKETNKQIDFIIDLQGIIAEELNHPTEKNKFLDKLTKYISDHLSEPEERTRFIGILPEIEH